jgi:ribosomal protein S27AE
VDPDNPDRTACGRSHTGVIDGMVFGGEIVGHDHPFACSGCRAKLKGKTSAIHQAHGLDPNDDTRVRHCPSCGAGDVWGGSSGDVHCDSCGMTFTVQAQPEYPQMPQNLQGMPLDINGDLDPTAMGDQGGGVPFGDDSQGDVDGQAGGGFPPGQEGDDEDEDEEEEGSPEDEEDQGKNGSSFPPKTSGVGDWVREKVDPNFHHHYLESRYDIHHIPHSHEEGDEEHDHGLEGMDRDVFSNPSYSRTHQWPQRKPFWDPGRHQHTSSKSSRFYLSHQGGVMDKENLVNYLAIRHAPNRQAMIRAVKEYNTAR